MTAVLRVVLWSFILFSAQAFAQARIVPGDYLTERGWGSLTIGPAGNDALKFSIVAVGGNTHVCQLEGEIRNGKANVEAQDPRKPCIVTFTPKGVALDVTVNDGIVCRFFCGERAHFPALYLKASRACAAQGVKKTREEFKRTYDKRDYAKAQSLIEPLLEECRRILDPLTEGWIRNDLAITQYRRGDAAGCRRTLRTLEKDAAKSDEALREDAPPSAAESYIAVVKAARANLKLCSAASK